MASDGKGCSLSESRGAYWDVLSHVDRLKRWTIGALVMALLNYEPIDAEHPSVGRAGVGSNQPSFKEIAMADTDTDSPAPERRGNTDSAIAGATDQGATWDKVNWRGAPREGALGYVAAFRREGLQPIGSKETSENRMGRAVARARSGMTG